jgi:hypothetical protein
MPEKKKKVAKTEEVSPKETPKVEKPLVEATQSGGQVVTSAVDLNLKFEKVNLIDRNDIYVGLTDDHFHLDGVDYNGRDHFLVMFSNSQMYAVAKAFFNKIAQVMPT